MDVDPTRTSLMSTSKYYKDVIQLETERDHDQMSGSHP